ncbi:unnamed protein product [Ambrosiozyma monospora]|uniref:Unnamed protein product n=1 Tax=Ambrosiozyma monospora TaxID=43982 RepID=A0ACB5SSI2_AMBMO|nr:unnamed protein product [Ambrosiozyma monospora]
MPPRSKTGSKKAPKKSTSVVSKGSSTGKKLNHLRSSTSSLPKSTTTGSASPQEADDGFQYTRLSQKSSGSSRKSAPKSRTTSTSNKKKTSSLFDEDEDDFMFSKNMLELKRKTYTSKKEQLKQKALGSSKTTSVSPLRPPKTTAKVMEDPIQKGINKLAEKKSSKKSKKPVVDETAEPAKTQKTTKASSSSTKVTAKPKVKPKAKPKAKPKPLPTEDPDTDFVDVNSMIDDVLNKRKKVAEKKKSAAVVDEVIDIDTESEPAAKPAPKPRKKRATTTSTTTTTTTTTAKSKAKSAPKTALSNKATAKKTKKSATETKRSTNKRRIQDAENPMSLLDFLEDGDDDYNSRFDDPTDLYSANPTPRKKQKVTTSIPSKSVSKKHMPEDHSELETSEATVNEPVKPKKSSAKATSTGRKRKATSTSNTAAAAKKTTKASSVEKKKPVRKIDVIELDDDDDDEEEEAEPPVKIIKKHMKEPSSSAGKKEKPAAVVKKPSTRKVTSVRPRNSKSQDTYDLHEENEKQLARTTKQKNPSRSISKPKTKTKSNTLPKRASPEDVDTQYNDDDNNNNNNDYDYDPSPFDNGGYQEAASVSKLPLNFDEEDNNRYHEDFNINSTTMIPLHLSPVKRSSTKSRTEKRRSSLSNRGKRLSSIGNGFVAEPHHDIPVDQLYKHFEPGLPDPHKMRQLLIWCVKRTTFRDLDPASSVNGNGNGKANGIGKKQKKKKNDVALKIAEVIRDDLIRELADGKISTSWWGEQDVDIDNELKQLVNGSQGSQGSSSQHHSSQTPIRIKPNPANVENKKYLDQYTAKLAELNKERQMWLDDNALCKGFPDVSRELLE